MIQKTKQMANAIQASADLWDLELYLTQRRKEIDRRYDFRSSRLIDVLARLLCEKRISEEDLGGLREDKMNSIRTFAESLGESALDLHSANADFATHPKQPFRAASFGKHKTGPT